MYSDFFVVHSTVCKSHDIVRFPRRHFDKLSKNCETLFTRDESSYQWEKEIDGLEISSYRENRGPLKFVSLATSPRLVRFFPLEFFFFFFFFSQDLRRFRTDEERKTRRAVDAKRPRFRLSDRFDLPGQRASVACIHNRKMPSEFWPRPRGVSSKFRLCHALAINSIGL